MSDLGKLCIRAAGRGVFKVCVCVYEPLKPCLTLAAALNSSAAGKKRADASSLGCIGPPNRKYH